MTNQQKDNKLIENARKYPDRYTLRTFHGAGKTRRLICKDNQICVPSTLQKRMVEWYHNHLCHPGETRTEQQLGSISHGIIYIKQYMIYAVNATPANCAKETRTNMENFLRNKLSMYHGRPYVWT